MEEEKPSIDNPRTNKMLDTVLLYSLITSCLGAILNLKHLPFSKEVLIVGLGSIVTVALAKAAIKNTLSAFIQGAAISLASLAVLFKLCHFPQADLLIKLAIATGIVYALNEAKNAFTPKDNDEEK